MPPLDIPGYYYDEAKNKYFKIMPSGPHSLAAIKQAQKDLEVEKAEEIATLHRKRLERINLARFCRSRETQVRQIPAWLRMAQGSRSLFKQLTVDTQISLSRYRHQHFELHSAIMDVTSSPDRGEAVVGTSDGRVFQYGYQIDPFFHMWGNTLQPFYQTGSTLTSIHFEKAFTMNGSVRRSVVGTSLSHLWRYSYLNPPPLTSEDAIQLAESAPTLSEGFEGKLVKTGAVFDGVGQTGSWQDLRDYSFRRRKDTFWTSAISDHNGTVLVGSDFGLYCLSDHFDLISRVKSKSSVLASAWIPSQPNLAWLGCRNGSLRLFDERSNSLLPFFTQSSAIAHVVPLENSSSGNLLLAAGMDTSIYVWDWRKPAAPRAQSSQSQPLRKLKGHVNDLARGLAFDVDLTANLVVAAGSDHRLRLWSLVPDPQQIDMPFWSSEKFPNGPISTARLVTNPPQSQDVWFDHPSSRRSPGLLVCTPDHHNCSSMFWLSIPPSSSNTTQH